MTIIIIATVIASIIYFSAAFIHHCAASICRRHKAAIKSALLNKLAAMKSPELRKACTAAGIEWRNVRGKNKHLLVADMRAALMAIA